MTEKKDITVKEVIEQLRDIFGIGPDGPSTEDGGTFRIKASQHKRPEVVKMVFDYFEIHNLTDGECGIPHSGDAYETVFIVSGFSA